MSKAFTSEETPDASIQGRAAQSAVRGAERPITPEGYRALAGELRRLTDEERPRARAEPEPPVRELRLAEVQHRISLLEATLASVRLVEPPAEGAGPVRFGSRVTVEWEGGRRQALRIVGPDEAQVKAGLISVDSPLARGLLGRAVGDEVEIERPRGSETGRVITVA